VQRRSECSGRVRVLPDHSGRGFFPGVAIRAPARRSGGPRARGPRPWRAGTFVPCGSDELGGCLLRVAHPVPPCERDFSFPVALPRRYCVPARPQVGGRGPWAKSCGLVHPVFREWNGAGYSRAHRRCAANRKEPGAGDGRDGPHSRRRRHAAAAREWYRSSRVPAVKCTPDPHTGSWSGNSCSRTTRRSGRPARRCRRQPPLRDGDNSPQATTCSIPQPAWKPPRRDSRPGHRTRPSRRMWCAASAHNGT